MLANFNSQPCSKSDKNRGTPPLWKKQLLLDRPCSGLSAFLFFLRTYNKHVLGTGKSQTSFNHKYHRDQLGSLHDNSKWAGHKANYYPSMVEIKVVVNLMNMRRQYKVANDSRNIGKHIISGLLIIHYSPWENNIIYVLWLYSQPACRKSGVKAQWERTLNKGNFWSWASVLSGPRVCLKLVLWMSFPNVGYILCAQEPWIGSRQQSRDKDPLSNSSSSNSAVILGLKYELLTTFYLMPTIKLWVKILPSWLVTEGLDLHSDQFSRILENIWLLGSCQCFHLNISWFLNSHFLFIHLINFL